MYTLTDTLRHLHTSSNYLIPSRDAVPPRLQWWQKSTDWRRSRSQDTGTALQGYSSLVFLFHRTPTTAAVVADNDTLTAGPQSGREQPEDFVALAPTKPSLLAYVRSIFLCPAVQSHHKLHVSLE